jgi:ribosomal protein L40E
MATLRERAEQNRSYKANKESYIRQGNLLTLCLFETALQWEENAFYFLKRLVNRYALGEMETPAFYKAALDICAAARCSPYEEEVPIFPIEVFKEEFLLLLGGINEDLYVEAMNLHADWIGLDRFFAQQDAGEGAAVVPPPSLELAVTLGDCGCHELCLPQTRPALPQTRPALPPSDDEDEQELCPSCNYRNAGTSSCPMCAHVPFEQEQQQEDEEQDEEEQGYRLCQSCSHRNPIAATNCLMCKKASLPSHVEKVQEWEKGPPPYNAAYWPSPVARLIAFELGLTRNKRCKHVDALQLLANRFSLSVDELLMTSRTNILVKFYPELLKPRHSVLRPMLYKLLTSR